jgi:hypothetical protein
MFSQESEIQGKETCQEKQYAAQLHETKLTFRNVFLGLFHLRRVPRMLADRYNTFCQSPGSSLNRLRCHNKKGAPEQGAISVHSTRYRRRTSTTL